MSLKLRAPFKRAHLTAAATVIALGLGVVPGLGLAGANAVESTTDTVENAVYRGPGAWGAAKIADYETAVGHEVDYVLDFQATDTWSNQAWPDWQANAWKGRTVVLGATGIFPGGWDRTFNGTKVGWSQAAKGEYDAHWRRLGERLVAKGQANAILRGAHEFNGGWFAHRVHPEEAADFVAAWRRWVTIMRAVPGQAFVFDWNPTLGKEWPLYKPEIAYPGDAYVDHIALDVYDGWYNRGWKVGGTPPTTAERDAVWNEILNGERGLRFWRDFAAARGKKLSLPEWGIRVWSESDGLIHGGGDNAAFVQRMAAIIKDPAWRIGYHAFWEDPKQGIVDPDDARPVPVPAARAAYLKAFGGTSTSPTAAPSTPAPTAAPATPAPTASPTVAPTTSPTVAPTTASPTVAPTTQAPTATPTTSAPLTTVPTVATTGLDCTKGLRAASASELPLYFSRWKDRSWKSELTGRTVSGDVFAWVTTTGAQKVRFGLDATTPRVDVEAPFDLVGGNKWWADALKTSTLTKGQHSVQIVAQRTDGCLTRTATFTVA